MTCLEPKEGNIRWFNFEKSTGANKVARKLRLHATKSERECLKISKRFFAQWKNVEKPGLNVDETVKISFRGKKFEHRINLFFGKQISKLRVYLCKYQLAEK